MKIGQTRSIEINLGHYPGYSIITKLAENVFKVISEPGDATHYDYYVIRLYDDEFSIAAGSSTFKFPRKIRTFDIDENSSPDFLEKKYDCNYYTYLECVRTIKELGTC